MERSSKYVMIEVENAIEIVIRNTPMLPVVLVPILDCCGYIIAKDVVAKDPFPSFVASTMDGYAVTAPISPGTYTVINRIRAGDSHESTSGSDKLDTNNSVSYITTGARLPSFANAVVKVEDTESVPVDINCVGATTTTATAATDEKQVIIKTEASIGMNIRTIGCDINVNEVILKKGQVIRSAEIGLLATVGVTTVPCYKKPIIGVMSTGNELVEIDAVPVGSEIRDSNRISLITAFRHDNYECIDLGIVKDIKSTLHERLLDASNLCDVVISSGGVSMGDADFVKPLLESLGNVHFGRLNMKPGKPTTFATLKNKTSKKTTLYFGLPGNPVSCLVTKSLMIDPALKRMQGIDSIGCIHPQVWVKLASAVKLDSERPEYHRALVSLDDKTPGSLLLATSTGNQNSSRLMSMSSCNALLCLPKGSGMLQAGAMITALLIAPISSPSLSSCYHQSAASIDYPTSSPAKTVDIAAATHLSCCTATKAEGKLMITVGILTVSDRASEGIYPDESGPEIAKLLLEMSQLPDWPLDVSISCTNIVPDDVNKIQSKICDWVDKVDMIITTGGTGFGKRDYTPEAIRPLLTREAPAVAQALINEGLKHTNLAVLSRPVVGTRGNTFICTLPGSVKAVRENIVALKPLLPRIMYLLKE